MLRSRPLALPALLALALALSLVAVGPAPEAGAQATPVVRVGSDDRAHTAAEATRAGFPDGAPTVLVASSEVFADALAAAGLAGSWTAPLLYTDPHGLPEATAVEVARLAPQRVVVLGGTQAVHAEVDAALRALGVPVVDRLAGINRFDTAARLAVEVLADGGDHAYLALGSHPQPERAWADAVAVSGLAARTRRPTLLTAPDALPPETEAAIRSLGLARVTVVGGTAAIGEGVVDQLRGLGIEVDRLAGETRYLTSLAITDALLASGGGTGEVWVSTGGDFADALATGPIAAQLGGVMLLADAVAVEQQPLLPFLTAYRESVGIVRVAGGPSRFPDHVLALIRAALGADIPEDAVPVAPGQDIRDLFEEHEPGTAFVFGPGVHRGVSVPVRSGDRYYGAPGSVLDGSRPLPASAFTAEGGRWVARGVPSDLPTSGTYGCRSWLEDPDQFALCGHEHEVHRSEQLFLDGQRLRHVNSVGEVAAPGTWHYDPVAEAVWMHDAPAGRDVALSDTAFAFAGYMSTDVLISGMTVRRYGSPSRKGAIDALDTERWTITNSEVSSSHGYGIRIGRETTVTATLLADNGQLGMGGSAHDTAVTVVGNEIARNGQLGYQRNYEIGGLKITHSIGALIAENHAHDNAAKGLWLDGLNDLATIRDNLVERSGQTGILYEISYAARIHGNTLLDNHTDGTTTESYGSLQVVNSRDVEVFDNVMRGGGMQELTVYDTDIYPGVADVVVRDNDITVDTQWPEGTYGLKDLRADKSTPIPGVVFEGNTLRIVQSADRPFAWDSQLISAEDWLRVHPGDVILQGG